MRPPNDFGDMLDRRARRDDPSAWSARGRAGVVASAHFRATEAGRVVLAAGGNAADAAVAVSAALGVTEPQASGLGGMAMIVMHHAPTRRTFSIEAPCRAPSAASPEALRKLDDRYRGWTAIAVPTNVAALDHLLRRYGTMPAATVLEPAIALAEEGVPVTPLLHRLIEQNEERLAGSSLAATFLPEGRVPPVGTVLRQPALARTLRRLAAAGFDDFYVGDVGRAIVRDVARRGGFLRAEDFASVPTPVEGIPSVAAFGGVDVHALGPPAGGATLLQIVRLWTELGLVDADLDDPDTAVHLAHVLRFARSDRRACADRLLPGTMPVALLGRRAVAEAAKRIRAEDPALGETTHFVVADREGSVVSVTQSIERSFGASEASEDVGVLYNGFMRGFKIYRKQHPHYLRPGAVARSNASPTIAFREGRPVAALGATGSERSPSAIFQVLARLNRQSAFDAVRAPRLHATPEGVVLLESRFADAVSSRLVASGFLAEPQDSYAFKLGGLHLLARDDDGAFVAVADPRRDGAASAIDA